MKATRFVSNYVKAKDLKDPLTVTISAAEEKEFTNEGKTKTSLVLFFKELEQGIVVCKESILQIIELLGSDETDEWVGQKVVIFNDPNVKYGGKRVGGIRFRAAAKK